MRNTSNNQKPHYSAFRPCVKQRNRWRVRIVAFILIVEMILVATVDAQPHVPTVQDYQRQHNQAVRAEQQRRFTAAEAQAVINQSQTRIKNCESRLSKVKTELKEACDDVDRLTKSLEECESELGDARKTKSEHEAKLLASQDASSKYQVLTRQLKETDEIAAGHASRILGHAVKDGDPDKLRMTVGKSDFKLLENDKDFAEVFKQHRKLKDEKADEVKRLFGFDNTIERLGATVQKDTERKKTLKSDLGKATARKKKFFNERDTLTANIEIARKNLSTAENVLARTNLR